MAPKKKEKPMSKKQKERLEKAEAEKKAKQITEGDMTKQDKAAVLQQAVITGNLQSRHDSRDLKVGQFSVTTFGKTLVNDTTLELNHGRKYGLIGQNGSGKSTILAAIAAKEIPVPDIIDMWFLDSEAAPSDMSAVEAVITKAKEEHERLEALTMQLLEEDADANADLIEQIGDKLDKMEPQMFESKACELLHGLGFDKKMMAKATKDMSGGWRMRVSLAQALFVQPTLLLLDEPTNHLDLGACVWLENYLANYPSTILMVSHSEDFLNNVCTHIMQLTHDGHLKVWGGNYATYVKTREDVEKNQMTKWKKEQDDIAHLLNFIRSCGTYANLRKQADSKQKIIDKMVEAGLTEKPVADPKYAFRFPDAEKLPPPVMAFEDVSFSYSGNPCDYLYTKLNFGVDLDSRIALVGPNGAGKSTLLKLMKREIEPCVGQVKKHGHLRIGQYNQHSEDILDMEKSPLQFFEEMYSEGITTTTGKRKLETEEWRSYLGRFGVTGMQQTRPMKTMSHGFHTRVVFVMMSLTNPHILLLDEPTNHLDMQCIDSLADAINAFTGGLVLVSHDFRLIGQVAKEIWVCDNKTVAPWKGDIQTYKAHLKKSVLKKFVA
jgi:ATP-binding cassette subfamily F protein 2